MASLLASEEDYPIEGLVTESAILELLKVGKRWSCMTFFPIGPQNLTSWLAIDGNSHTY